MHIQLREVSLTDSVRVSPRVHWMVVVQDQSSGSPTSTQPNSSTVCIVHLSTCDIPPMTECCPASSDTGNVTRYPSFTEGESKAQKPAHLPGFSDTNLLTSRASHHQSPSAHRWKWPRAEKTVVSQPSNPSVCLTSNL